jgi:hypothetical protein
VSPLRELAAVQQQITAAGAAVVGMVLLMAMVSLMMGMALPDRRFIGYAGYLLTLALLFATSENLQASLWFQDSPVAAVRLHSSRCAFTARPPSPSHAACSTWRASFRAWTACSRRSHSLAAWLA